MPVPSREIKVRIAADVDWLCRDRDDAQRRLRNARTAATELAARLSEFLEDPAAMGTNALREAYNEFLSADAGNFNGPEKARPPLAITLGKPAGASARY